MRKNIMLKYGNEKENIVLTPEDKKDLNEVINNQINTLIKLQKKLNESDKNIIRLNIIKDIIFKTEYFIFKLKSTI